MCDLLWCRCRRLECQSAWCLIATGRQKQGGLTRVHPLHAVGKGLVLNQIVPPPARVCDDGVRRGEGHEGQRGQEKGHHCVNVRTRCQGKARHGARRSRRCRRWSICSIRSAVWNGNAERTIAAVASTRRPRILSHSQSDSVRRLGSSEQVKAQPLKLRA